MTAIAYVAGVLLGDGWCTEGPHGAIGLRVSDADFASTFAVALELATGSLTRPYHDERGYWSVRNQNHAGRFSHLKGYEPQTDEECAAWLRGLFDSEGNAQLRIKPGVGPNSYGRRVAMYSTNTETLRRAQTYLERLAITSVIRPQKHSDGHKGTLPLFELSLDQSRENFLRFAWLVGSSIARKRDVLMALPLSYRADPGESCRSAQRIGAAAKHRKTIEVTLPAVVAAVRQLIDQGINPTQRACLHIPGYTGILRHVGQADLVAMAKGEMPIGKTKTLQRTVAAD